MRPWGLCLLALVPPLLRHTSLPARRQQPSKQASVTHSRRVSTDPLEADVDVASYAVSQSASCVPSCARRPTSDADARNRSLAAVSHSELRLITARRTTPDSQSLASDSRPWGSRKAPNRSGCEPPVIIAPRI
ncbi:hypothetical protein BV20DRAFT_298793 [Pilatotrama ljubarskyi]|nr:hypothetical protein BV20DRAFT_298793 [Pilatotrama ljubarskyi]